MTLATRLSKSSARSVLAILAGVVALAEQDRHELGASAEVGTGLTS